MSDTKLTPEEADDLAEAIAAEQSVANVKNVYDGLMETCNTIIPQLIRMTGGANAQGPVVHYRSLAFQKMEEFIHRVNDCRAVLQSRESAAEEAVEKASKDGKILQIGLPKKD